MLRQKTFAIEVALDKALELFCERGYHGTSMPLIAAHLKLSRSTMYTTFRAKPALFVQALRHYHVECRAPGLSELRAAGAPRAALVKAFEVAGASGEERHRRALALVIEAARGLKPRVPEMERLVEETIENLEVRFRDAIERGRAAAEIADCVDPVAVARVLLSLYIGLYLLVGNGAAGEPMRSAVLQQVETLLPAPRSERAGDRR